MLGRIPHLVAADAGFYSAKNEWRQSKGSNECAFPIAPQSPERKREQKSVGL